MGSKWALVYWLKSRQYSIVKEEFVLDKLMLNDPYVVGRVSDADSNKRIPPGGWKKFDARILATSVSRLALERSAEALCEHYNCPLQTTKNSEENGTTECNAAELCQSVLTNQIEHASNGHQADDNEGDEERIDVSAASLEEIASSSSPLLLQVLNHYLTALMSEVAEIRKDVLEMKQSMKSLTREVQSCRKEVPASGNDYIQNAIGEVERKLHEIIPGGERELLRILQAGGGSTTVLRKLLEAAFSPDELVNSSITGQNTERNALDPAKLGIIIEFMCLKFTDQTESTVKDYIRSKLRYKRRLAKQGEEPLSKKNCTTTMSGSTESDPPSFCAASASRSSSVAPCSSRQSSFPDLHFVPTIGRTRTASGRLSAATSGNYKREFNA